jgi:ornithine cyclodeaminase
MRTGSASGVATKWMAAPSADEFAIIGTGKQAMTQVAAVVAVRPIRRIRVYGPNQERREAFAERVRKAFDLPVVAAKSIAEAVDGATVVTVVTRATEPILTAGMLTRGAHINTVGAILPSRAELAGDVLARASMIVADSVPQARKLSRELMDFFRDDADGWARVRPLSSVVKARPPRSASDDLTVFKSTGHGHLGSGAGHRAISLGRGLAARARLRASPKDAAALA